MSYASYVFAAYAVFVAVLLWDFVVPRIQIRQLLRAVRVLAARKAARAPAQGTADARPADTSPTESSAGASGAGGTELKR